MPIAKEIIRLGFTVVALPGGFVSKAAVKRNGWEKLVDDGPDMKTSGESTKDSLAPSETTKKK